MIETMLWIIVWLVLSLISLYLFIWLAVLLIPVLVVVFGIFASLLALVGFFLLEFVIDPLRNWWYSIRYRNPKP